MRIERIGDATLYLGDCLEILPTLDKVDAVVTDPPYGIGDKWQGGKGHHWANQDAMKSTRNEWDAKRPSAKIFDMMLQGSESQIIWGGNYFADLLPPTRCWLVWDKGQHGLTMADGELAYTSMDKPLRVKILNRAALQYDGGAKHPTQKPVAIMSWCVDMTYGSVLDPFMGSGTTGVACANLGRKFIGIEIEEKYFDIACERITAAYAQGRLFA